MCDNEELEESEDESECDASDNKEMDSDDFDNRIHRLEPLLFPVVVK